jgi:hypothetical protein
VSDAARALKEFRISLRNLAEAVQKLGPAGAAQAQEIQIALSMSDDDWAVAAQIKLTEQNEAKRYAVGESIIVTDPRTRMKTPRRVVITPALRAGADLVI